MGSKLRHHALDIGIDGIVINKRNEFVKALASDWNVAWHFVLKHFHEVPCDVLDPGAITDILEVAVEVE